jgi:hypothetical protein
VPNWKACSRQWLLFSERIQFNLFHTLFPRKLARLITSTPQRYNYSSNFRVQRKGDTTNRPNSQTWSFNKLLHHTAGEEKDRKKSRTLKGTKLVAIFLCRAEARWLVVVLVNNPSPTAVRLRPEGLRGKKAIKHNRIRPMEPSYKTFVH